MEMASDSAMKSRLQMEMASDGEKKSRLQMEMASNCAMKSHLQMKTASNCARVPIFKWKFYPNSEWALILQNENGASFEWSPFFKLRIEYICVQSAIQNL